MGTYTPNYNLYMPSIGEQGWGNLVSNNFEILDTNLNNLQDQINTINTQIDTIDTQIDTINTNIGDGTRILSISSPPIINSENFSNCASYDNNNVYIAQFSGENVTFSSIPQPPHSCRLMIISMSGNLTINGNINTYPTSLQYESPPNSAGSNTYAKTIQFGSFSTYTLTYTANANNSQITMDYNDYLNFINVVDQSIKTYSLSIPAATAAGGSSGNNGTAGTATNTCNGGGGGSGSIKGGTGCIFGQYAGGTSYSDYSGYGYGTSASNKYGCALIIIVNGNLTLNSTITQRGGNGNSSSNSGGYGGGARYGGGGGGAPVFIYYTGSYTNNGSINVNGGYGSFDFNRDNTDGGAGGIKVTKISI